MCLGVDVAKPCGDAAALPQRSGSQGRVCVDGRRLIAAGAHAFIHAASRSFRSHSLYHSTHTRLPRRCAFALARAHSATNILYRLTIPSTLRVGGRDRLT
uniref:Uncharacterized protein n=1 Tax=Plectus sambesii TaxID=2011161 RepID=A0A914V8U2_9BILA